MPDWLARLLSPNFRRLEDVCERRAEATREAHSKLWASEGELIQVQMALGRVSAKRETLETQVEELQEANLSTSTQLINAIMGLSALQKWAKAHGWAGWTDCEEYRP